VLSDEEVKQELRKWVAEYSCQDPPNQSGVPRSRLDISQSQDKFWDS
jgi:hypothetical protein